MITGASAPVIAELAQVWPAVARALLGQLRRRGSSAHAAEDIVQEVAAKVLTARPAFDSADDLLRWASTVARRVAVDQHRSEVRRADTALEDAAARADDRSVSVEDRVLVRLQAEQILAGVSLLSPQERRALVEGEDRHNDRRAQVRLAVRRHRARAHLARIVEGLGAAIGAAAGWFRWLKGRTARVLAAASLVLVVIATAVHLETTPDRPVVGVGRAAVETSTRPASRAAFHASDEAPRPQSAASPPRRREAAVAHARLPPPLPGWQPGHVTVERKSPDDHALCLGIPTVGPLCVG